MHIIKKVICLLLLPVTFISCESEEQDLVTTVPDENVWYWGEFDGTINSKYVSFFNADYNDRFVYSQISGLSEPGVSCDRANILTISVKLDSIYCLRLAITDFADKKEWNLTNFVNYEIKSEFIFIEKIDFFNRDEEYMCIPKAENPFNIKLTDQKWISGFDVITKLNLNGTLYNRVNPNDSVVIDAYLGTHK